uniref:CUB domain-containing protein n=1 Tax=Catagonus wagneri TaxID=51154 RepID=A0A8C3WAG5_9CETA
PWSSSLSPPPLLRSPGSLPSPSDYRVCGGHLTDDYGTISTHEGPHTECVWTLQVDPNYKILVSMTSLNLTCGKEYVELLDGPPGSKSLGKFCNGLSILSRGSTSTMTVKYSRDSDHPTSPYEIIFLRDSQSK